MPRYAYDRLTAQDTSFLVFENSNSFTHGAGTAIFEAGALATPGGGIDIDRVRRSLESMLHQVPRFRQKLDWIPVERHPVWVDDPAFDLDYHLRHIRLPAPGTLAELKATSARILANRMDRARPLWEFWVVEGLENGGFALIQKIHHCMIDGASGVDLLQLMMSPDPEAKPLEPTPWVPRPAPTQRQLALDALRYRLRMPLDVLRSAREAGSVRDLGRDLRTRLSATAKLARSMTQSAAATPLNERIGPHRRVDWLCMSLDDVKQVRRALGGTINDVVLCSVAGAVRRFLQLRGVDTEALDFRVAAPVSVRSEDERGTMGNRVSQWIVDIPVGEPDPLERLRVIQEQTSELKSSGQAVGADVLFQVAEWTGTRLLSLAAQLASSGNPFNLMVTNIPGPQIPLYLCGARLLEMYGYVPLVDTTALGIALFSYDGRLCWGFNADYELLPDLADFVSGIERAFAELQRLAASTGPA